MLTWARLVTYHHGFLREEHVWDHRSLAAVSGSMIASSHRYSSRASAFEMVCAARVGVGGGSLTCQWGLLALASRCSVICAYSCCACVSMTMLPIASGEYGSVYDGQSMVYRSRPWFDVLIAEKLARKLLSESLSTRISIAFIDLHNGMSIFAPRHSRIDFHRVV